MSKYATKERLFEITGRLDKTFKPKLNEVSYANNVDEFKNLVQTFDSGQAQYAKQMLNSIVNNGNLEALKVYLAEMGEYEVQAWVTSQALSEEEITPDNLAVSSVGGVVEGGFNTKVVRTKEYLDELNKIIGELYSQMVIDGMNSEEAKKDIIFMCNNALKNLQ